MKSFYSKVSISAMDAVQHGLSNHINCQQVHEWICKMFPDFSVVGRDFLFCLEEQPHEYTLSLLTERCPVFPEWVAVKEPKQTELTESFFKYKRYWFKTLAWPSIRKNRRRISIYDDSGIRTWFERKFNEAGCRVESGSFTFVRLGEVWGSRKTGTVKFYPVRATGRIQVIDEKRLRAAYDKGIGAGKCFGYGLLNLLPLR